MAYDDNIIYFRPEIPSTAEISPLGEVLAV